MNKSNDKKEKTCFEVIPKDRGNLTAIKHVQNFATKCYQFSSTPMDFFFFCGTTPMDFRDEEIEVRYERKG